MPPVLWSSVKDSIAVNNESMPFLGRAYQAGEGDTAVLLWKANPLHLALTAAGHKRPINKLMHQHEDVNIFGMLIEIHVSTFR